MNYTKVPIKNNRRRLLTPTPSPSPQKKKKKKKKWTFEFTYKVVTLAKQKISKYKTAKKSSLEMKNFYR